MAGAGNLDRRIRLESKGSSQDALGGETDAEWTPIGTVWANRFDVNDSERVEADEMAATRMTRFVVRSSSWSKKMLADDRIFHDGAFYEIIGIKETRAGRNNLLEFTTVVRADWEADL